MPQLMEALRDERRVFVKPLRAVDAVADVQVHTKGLAVEPP